MKAMKALVVPAPDRLEVADIAAPVIGPYDALVRIETCGICNSTDQKLIEGAMYWAPPFPFVLGHESVGAVVEVGAKVRNFKVGDRVTRPIYVPPPADTPGDAQAALNAAMGGFAEFGIVRDARARADDGDASLLNDYNAQRQLVVPEQISARDAALGISLAETASVLRHLPNARSQTIVVAGTGIAGLAFCLWFKLAGARRVIVLGRRAARLAHARRAVGADEIINTREAGWLETLASLGPLDGAVEATGDAPLAAQLLDALKPDAFACAYGVPPAGTDYASRWQKAQVEEHLAFFWVCDLLQRGWVRPDWFVSHEWPFSNVREAFEANRRGEVVKGFVHLQN